MIRVHGGGRQMNNVKDNNSHDPFANERKPDAKYEKVSKYTIKKLNAKMNITETPDVLGKVVVNLPAGSPIEVVSVGATWTKTKNGYVMSCFLD